MKPSILIFLSGFLYQGSQAIECYACVDCQGELGTALDCSSLSSTYCYLTQTLSTGKVSKSCGFDSSTDVGCSTADGLKSCRCTGDLCNTVDLLSTTTTTVTTTDRNRLYCYQCVDCGNTVGELTDCSQYSRTPYCYYFQETSGERRRRCGTDYLDQQDYRVGCNTVFGFTACKCAESACNRYLNLTDGATTTSTTTSSTTTTITTSTPTTINTPWYCYVCVNCGESIGELQDCSQVSKSKSCLLLQFPSGQVSKSCGLVVYDNGNTELLEGCQTRQGITYCKCKTNACNIYPDKRVTASNAATTNEISSKSPWSCYVCEDCGRSLGRTEQCPDSSCSFVIKDTIVTRSCGVPQINVIIPKGEECTTTAGGTTVCHCLERNCNVYQVLPQASDRKMTTWPWPWEATTQSGYTIKTTSWLVFLTCWCQIF